MADQGRKWAFSYSCCSCAVQLLAALTLLLAAPASALAETKHAAMVIDANTGKVLYQSHADAQRYPASLTKMMTLYLTFDFIERKRLKFSDRITISAQAAAQPPSKLGLKPGETITVRNAVLSLVTKSANDIATALAEHIGGSEANFARLMTQKARAMGMSKTTFKNASGLPDTSQTTTARDMLTLALRLQDDFPKHYKLFRTRSFTYGGKEYRNHNTLLRSFNGTDGIKTGYIRAAGFNLVSSVRRDNKHLVAAVFGGKTARRRNATMRAILTKALGKASTRKTRKPAGNPMLVATPKMVRQPQPNKRPSLAPSKAPLPTGAPIYAAAAVVANAASANSPAPAMRPPQATEPVNNHQIAIARVRQVAIDKHLSSAKYATPPHTNTAQPLNPGAAGRAIGEDPLSNRKGPRSIAELIAATGSIPPSGGVQFNGAITPAPSSHTPPALVSNVPADDPTPKRQPDSTLANNATATGRRPSSLQDQLSKILASNQPAALNSTAGSPGAVTNGTRTAMRPALKTSAQTSPNTHFIQIGAFNSATEAKQQLETVQAKAGAVLKQAAPVTQAVTRGDKRLFRARFAGFDSNGATAACQELRRKSIDCFVTRTR